MIKVTKEMKESAAGFVPVFNTTLLVTLIILVINFTRYIVKLEGRSFSTIEQRVEAEDHLDKAWSAEEVYMAMERLKAVESAVINLENQKSLGNDTIELAKKNSEDLKELKSSMERIERTLNAYIHQ